MGIIKKFDEEYYINMTIRRKGAYVTQLGRVMPTKGYEWHKRAIARHFFDYIDSGRGWVEYGGQRFSVGAGDLVFVKKGAAVDYGSDDADPYAKLWAAADGDLVTAAADCYLDGKEFLIIHGWNPEPLLRIKHAIAAHGQDERRVAPLILELVMSMAALPDDAQPESVSTPAERLKSYLDAHITEKLSLEQLEEHFHLSARHLSRIFKEHTGMTLGAYQCEQRLQAAARYLTETDLSVGAIAEELGYCDQSFFSTSFKRRFGVYPLAWRELNG